VGRLVVFAPNWLGDAVMALPAIADLRRGWSGGAIAVAARPSVASLFALAGVTDEVVTLKKGARPLRFEVAVLLPNSFHAALVAKRAGIPERWGYRTDWRGLLLTRAIERASSGVHLHQVDYYRRLVEALGFPNGPAVPRLDASSEARAAGLRLLRDGGWDERTPLVGLAPGAAYGAAKRWPPGFFAELAASLAADGVVSVLIGSAADRGTAAEVASALAGRARVVDLVGKTDLPALAGVIVNCRTLVANDSGAMHFAVALGVRVTALFGPNDERITGPWAPATRDPSSVRLHADGPAEAGHDVWATSRRPSVTVLTHDVWCRPCLLRECPLDHGCMRGISVDQVLDSTRRML
jgi:heptosyltransferase-2